MADSAEVAGGHVGGHAVAVLRSGDLEAAFAPGVGMVGCSLRHRGEELLGLRGGLDAYARSGSTMGIPLLAPWANRLSGLRYAAAGREVELRRDQPGLRLDPSGLPIHGLLAAAPDWEVVESAAEGETARLAARLEFGSRPERLAGFPFPHELTQAVSLEPDRLTLATTLRATGDSPVPVAFGHHPYLRLPGDGRAGWEVALPAGRRARADERGIPTGEWEAQEAWSGRLGERTYDDLFDDLGERPEFVLAGGDRRIAVRFDAGYPFAQVYAPPGQDFICFEPMTAPTNALVSGDRLALCPPGEAHVARFTLAVT